MIHLRRRQVEVLLRKHASDECFEAVENARSVIIGAISNVFSDSEGEALFEAPILLIAISMFITNCFMISRDKNAL